MADGKKNNKIRNTKTRDSSSKKIFDDPVLCAQFLRGYVDIDMLKDVQPEDIEDISERFIWLWQEGRDSDSVKKIRITKDGREISLYLIALIEHQSSVHYDMAFRILRYIVMILNDYAEDQEKLHLGITKTKGFRYPPILPIVFYDGTDSWTAARDFKDRVFLSDVLGEYIPSFQYLVVPLQKYTDWELIEKGDELSLIMLVDKLRNASDFRKLKDIPEEYLEHISKNSPESVLKLISSIIAVLLYKLNVPTDEVTEFTDRIERREFTMLLDNFEGYDVQATRRESKAEGRAQGKAEDVVDLLSELGPVPEKVLQRIMKETNLETLKRWLKTAARADSLQQFLENCPELIMR